jgi:4-hydroxy-3-polyprenylbenzoate decarboxylase
MGIDATRKWKEEGFDREWPERIVMDEETTRRVDEMWPRLGIRLAERRNGGTTERRNEKTPTTPERQP